MSPSLPAARRVCYLSLPAFAIILSFFWYRKKRGSLKIDSGGAVEKTRDEETIVINNCEKEPETNCCDNNKLSISEEEEEGEGEGEEEEKEKEKLIESGGIADRIELIGEEEEVEIVADRIELIGEEVKLVAEKSYAEPEIREEVTPKEVVVEDKGEEEEEEGDVREVREVKGSVSESSSSPSPSSPPQSPPLPLTLPPFTSKSKRMAKKMAKKAKKLEERKKKDNMASILEEKLAGLDLSSTKCIGGTVQEKPMDEDVAERDSANNSPSEVMMASPSVSGYSDTHSEGSSDSGKGCSEMLTPSRTPASGNSVSGDNPGPMVYEFEIPQYLVGRLIGKHGSNENEIKKATNATIYIKTHPTSNKMKICAVEGNQMDVDSALEMIRDRFPKKFFPQLTLEQVVILPRPLMFPIMPENYQLYLVEGINNDVILSSLISAGHFFLQQPTHPTYPALAVLSSYMAYCYSEPNQPHLPEGIGVGVLCAAPYHNGWFRAQIMEMEEGSELCSVKYLDYGGYVTLPFSSLRQIRADFINLPFQAAECFLADVKPANGEMCWSEEAKELVEKLTYGNMLQAQVYGYDYSGVPLIYLYAVVNHEFILINEELVNHGYAERDYCESVTEEGRGDDGAVECSEIVDSGYVSVPV